MRHLSTWFIVKLHLVDSYNCKLKATLSHNIIHLIIYTSLPPHSFLHLSTIISRPQPADAYNPPDLPPRKSCSNTEKKSIHREEVIIVINREVGCKGPLDLLKTVEKVCAPSSIQMNPSVTMNALQAKMT